MPVVLSIDTSLASKTGVVLKWDYSGLTEPIKEIAVSYSNNVVAGVIKSFQVHPASTEYLLPIPQQNTLYIISLQVVDANGTSYFSNSIQYTSPLEISPPQFADVAPWHGIHNGLVITLKSTSQMEEGNTVEFVLRKNTSDLFWIVKPWNASQVYTLTANDNPLLSNNNIYKVACMYQPSDSSRFGLASDMSSTLEMEPSNLPDALAIAFLRSPISTDYQVVFTYAPPADKAEWSDNYSAQIFLYKQNVLVQTVDVAKDADSGSYVFNGLEPNKTYSVDMKYTNRFGEGAGLDVKPSALVKGLPADFTEAPVAVFGDEEVLLTIPPLPDDFGSSIDHISVYIDFLGETRNIPIDDVDTGVITLDVPNGVLLSFQVKAINEVGASVNWSPVSNAGYCTGVPTLAVVANGKSVVAEYTPNGLELDNITCIAVDSDFVSSEASSIFATLAPQSNLIGKTTYTFDFSSFSGNVSKFLVVALDAEHSTLVNTF